MRIEDAETLCEEIIASRPHTLAFVTISLLVEVAVHLLDVVLLLEGLVGEIDENDGNGHFADATHRPHSTFPVFPQSIFCGRIMASLLSGVSPGPGLVGLCPAEQTLPLR